MHYAWGEKGDRSMICKLFKQSKYEPCAEVWVGTHPTNPTKTEKGTLA
jgi:mannose-6-phosphate isomerase class I